MTRCCPSCTRRPHLEGCGNQACTCHYPATNPTQET